MHEDNENEMAVVEEDERESRMYEIRLDEDIYSIGFITFLKATNTKQLERISLKALFAFMI